MFLLRCYPGKLTRRVDGDFSAGLSGRKRSQALRSRWSHSVLANDSCSRPSRAAMSRGLGEGVSKKVLKLTHFVAEIGSSRGFFSPMYHAGYAFASLDMYDVGIRGGGETGIKREFPKTLLRLHVSPSLPLCPCENSWRLRETEDGQGIVGGMHVKKPVPGLSRAEHGSRDHRNYRVCEVQYQLMLLTVCPPRSLQSWVPPGFTLTQS